MDINIELEIGWFSGRGRIARMHDTGGGKLPKRAHLTLVADSLEFREYINNDYIRKALANNIKDGMSKIGEAFITYYQNYVLSGKITPDLKLKTIASKKRKGSGTPQTPLLDTGEMISSIQYRVNT
ncbi:hypothetical protein [Candidatus Borreliella tachyglossi]|uniref:hypothetical protein n=1 Tax=Candidatus Borreliella tachyglossi TaxID=1964448 RepID=UPI0040419B9E